MLSLKEIRNPIEKEMGEFEEFFSSSMKSSVPLLNTVARYIVKRKGKQFRPMLVLLSAGMFGKINMSTYTGAGLIEFLHTATLIHDDVVDDSNERRGFFSVNALWKNKIAVLMGDYLLSKGLLLSLGNKEFSLLGIVSEAVREMSEGELLQIEKARNLDIKEPVYFEIIRKKTASLIASCCACGAASVTKDENIIRQMHLAGENTGIAFQIKDDLFDFGSSSLVGKPSGTDIKEKKMTLPLIHFLNNLNYFERKKYINIIKNHSDDHEKVRQLIDMVNNSKGIDYAKQKMNEYKEKALGIIKAMPESIYRNSLEELIHFTTERNN